MLGAYLLSLPIFARVPKALPKVEIVHTVTVTLVSSEELGELGENLLSKV